MEPHSPALGKGTFSQFGAGTFDYADRMTVQGTLNKSIGLMILALIAGAISWAAIDTNPSIGDPLLIVCAALGGILAWATIYAQDIAKYTAALYAICEGAVLGAVSLLYSRQSQGIVPQALGSTIAVMMLMLVLYRAGLSRASPVLMRVLLIGMLAIVVTYSVDLLLTVFAGVQLPIIDTPTPMGIGIQLVIVGIASLNFVVDFAFIEQGAEDGAPKYMEWYGAFSICLTLFWLYLEMLRLLSLLSANQQQDN
jgi:uncharacterized YccA/Bax inhibitor family protein